MAGGHGGDDDVQSIEIDVRTGRDRGFTDLTPACARFAAEAAAGGDGLLSVFVPHATAGIVILELGAGSDTDAMHTLDRLLPRDDRWTHRHGSLRSRRRPRPAAARRAVDHRPGAGRPARAGHLAVDRAARSQRRQRDPPRPPELPRRLTVAEVTGPHRSAVPAGTGDRRAEHAGARPAVDRHARAVGILPP